MGALFAQEDDVTIFILAYRPLNTPLKNKSPFILPKRITSFPSKKTKESKTRKSQSGKAKCPPGIRGGNTYVK